MSATAADSKSAPGAAAAGSKAAAPAAVELIVWSIGGGEDPAGPQAGFADGDGAKSALFRTPKGLAIDSLRDALYIADSGNHRIRRFGADDRVTTAAGSGTAGFKDGKLMDCEFNNPTAVAVDPATGRLYVADTGNKRIRCIDFFSGSVSTVAGNGGPLRSASGAQPSGGSSAAKVNVDDGKGDGACFESPDSLAFDPNGSGTLYVGDSGTGLVRLVDVKTRIVSTLKVGEDANIYRTATAGGLTAMDFNAADKLLYLTDGDRVMYLRASDGSLLLQPGTGTGAAGAQKEGGPETLSGGPVRGIYAHSRQHKLYVCDPDARAVRGVDELKGTVATVAGVVGERGHVDTAAERSKFDTPWGITWDAGVLYVADAGNHCVRLIGTSQALQARKERGNAPCRVCSDSDCVIA